jgi:hypothetical protein
MKQFVASSQARIPNLIQDAHKQAAVCVDDIKCVIVLAKVRMCVLQQCQLCSVVALSTSSSNNNTIILLRIDDRVLASVLQQHTGSVALRHSSVLHGTANFPAQ